MMYPGIATVNGVLVAKTISADKVMPLNAAAVKTLQMQSCVKKSYNYLSI